MQLNTSPALILSVIPYKESSYILDILTPQGREYIQAQSVREEKSKLRPHCIQGALVHIEYLPTKSYSILRGITTITTSHLAPPLYPHTKHIIHLIIRLVKGYDNNNNVLRVIQVACNNIPKNPPYNVWEALCVAQILHTLGLFLPLPHTKWDERYEHYSNNKEYEVLVKEINAVLQSSHI